MSKLLLVTFVVLMVAICTVSAGPGCSKTGGKCSISAGKIDCCLGYVCSSRDLRCELAAGPGGSPGYNKRPPPLPPKNSGYGGGSNYGGGSSGSDNRYGGGSSGSGSSGNRG